VVVHGWLLTTAAFVKEDTWWLCLFPLNGRRRPKVEPARRRARRFGATPNVSFV